MRARAIRDYRTQYANPVRFARGDAMVLGMRETEWPAFAWATTAEGNPAGRRWTGCRTTPRSNRVTGTGVGMRTAAAAGCRRATRS